MNPQQRQQQNPGYHALQILLYGVLALSLAQFICRVYVNFGTYYSVDMPLFLQTAYDYLANQVLYVRTDDLRHYYQPGAGVYKYPPLYQLTIIPWFAQGWPEDVYFIVLRITMLIMYLLSAGLIARKVAPIATSKIPFYAAAAITTLWFIPFHASYGVVSEIFILFLLSLFICFYASKPILSGSVLAVSSMLKVYPMFLIGFSIMVKNKKNILGFIVGCLLSIALTVIYFGLDENIFFFLKLLPVLLSEQVSQYGSNMNIEAFLLAKGLISQTTSLFNIQRVIVLGILSVVTYQYRDKLEKNIMLISSLWVCALLLFLTNYWLQYQLLLLLPIITLLACILKTRSIWPLLIMSLVVIVMSTDDSWSDVLFRKAMEKNNLTTEMVINMLNNNGMLRTGLGISPGSILIMLFSILKVFVPHTLFMLIAWTLLTFQQDKNTPPIISGNI